MQGRGQEMEQFNVQVYKSTPVSVLILAVLFIYLFLLETTNSLKWTKVQWRMRNPSKFTWPDQNKKDNITDPNHDLTV